jgi:cytochrome c oxidase subunit 2
VTDTRHEFDDLFFGLYLPVALVVTVLVVGLVLFAILRRRSPESVSRRSRSTAGESLYAALLLAVAVVLVGFTFRADDRIHEPGEAAAEIDVTASQWAWRFDYGDGRVVFGTDRRRPELVVPAGDPVRFRLTSEDVIHAFWIPERRFKRDAIPGTVTTFVLAFPRPGRLDGTCAEFCGLRHSDMRFDVRVLPRAEFERWLRG